MSQYLYPKFFPLFFVFSLLYPSCGVFILWTSARGFPSVLFQDLVFWHLDMGFQAEFFAPLSYTVRWLETPLGLQSGELAWLFSLLPARVSNAGILPSSPQLTSVPDPLSSNGGFGYMISQPVCFLIFSVQVLTKCGVGVVHCSGPSGSTPPGEN